MVKLFHFDNETTGRDAKKHGIHQIAAIFEIDGEIVETVDLKMRPAPWHEIEPRALEVSGVTVEQIQAYELSQLQGMNKLRAVLAKHFNDEPFHRVGWNIQKFDDEFLFEFLGSDAFLAYFYSNSIDVLSLASNALRETRASLPNFKLGTVAAHLGITATGDLHDALVDVQITMEIYKFLNGERGL